MINMVRIPISTIKLINIIIFKLGNKDFNC